MFYVDTTFNLYRAAIWYSCQKYNLLPNKFFSILMMHLHLENTNKPYDITVFVQGNIIPGYKKGAIVLNVIYAGGIHLIEGC